MTYSPVVLFTYNRPDSTKLVLESLALNNEAKETELYVFSDAARNENQEKNVQMVRGVIEAFDKTKFKSVHIKYQTKNQGLARSIIVGVSEVLDNHQSVIVIEDDCVVSTFFLAYMNSALEKYSQNEQVGSITGYSPALKNVPRDDVYAVMRSCSWTWGTWKHVWDKVDFDVRDYKKLRYKISFIKNLNKCGNDRMYRFIRQHKYNVQSWSIRFGAYLARRQLLTLYPKYSYVSNVGLDYGGVHSSPNAPKAMKVKNTLALEHPILPEKIREDKSISKEFRRIYGGSVISQIGRTFYVYGGERIIDAVRGKK